MKDWKPAGYTSVAPYLVVSDATATIKFLVDALDGTQLRTVLRPDGTIMHAEVRIDDTVVMLAQGNDQWPPAPSSVHIYVRDVDASYARALAARSCLRHDRTTRTSVAASRMLAARRGGSRPRPFEHAASSIRQT